MSTADILLDPSPPVVSRPSPEILLSKAEELWAQWDRLVNSTVASVVERLIGDDADLVRSPVTIDRRFTGSPTPLMTLMLAYLLTVILGLVFVKGKGKGEGEKVEDPPLLRIVVQCHNLFLIVLSTYMFTTVVYQAFKNNYKLWGTGYNVEEKEMANVIYIFFVSKIYEYLDTVVMIVKRNMRQVTLLHVYHHVSISFIWWVIAVVAPGGDAWYSCALNSLVHVIMYTYYFLASVVGKDPKKRKKYLWWGKYMTQFQMFQFVTMMGQAYYCYHHSTYPKFLSSILFWYMQTLLLLFGNFYIKKYLPNFTKQKRL